MPPIVIGCDLSRAWIEIHTLPEGTSARMENTPSAVARWAAGLDPACLFVFEATSGCDGPLIEALSSRGIAFARVNPRQAREFARATGIVAKTDRVDARVLAEMGRRLPLEASPAPHPDRVRLADFLRRRRQLVEARKAEKNRRHDAGQPEILRDIESMIALLDRRIEKLDRQIAAIIESTPALAAKAQLLAPVPGIGPTVLATLLGELPELGTLCRRRIPPSPGSPRTPARAEPGAGPGASGAAGAGSARRSTSRPSPPRDASRASSRSASACAPPARRRRPS